MNKKGFTFLEILFMVVVISVGLLAIMNWVPVAIQTKIKTERRTGTIFLAQAKIEEAKRILLSNFSATDTDIPWAVCPAEFNCTGSQALANTNLKTITVNVRHNESPDEITTFSTQVARR